MKIIQVILFVKLSSMHKKESRGERNGGECGQVSGHKHHYCMYFKEINTVRKILMTAQSKRDLEDDPAYCILMTAQMTVMKTTQPNVF